MSLIVQLPTFLVTFLIQNWLWLGNVRALDSATCNRTDRVLLLSILKRKNIVLRGCPDLRGQKLRCFIKWILNRRVILRDIRFSSTPNRRVWCQLVPQLAEGLQFVHLCFKSNALSPNFLIPFNEHCNSIEHAEILGLKRSYLLAAFLNENRLSLNFLSLHSCAVDILDQLSHCTFPALQTLRIQTAEIDSMLPFLG